MALSLLQQLMVNRLKKQTVKEHKLEARCPLNHGKHNCKNTADACVGDLSAFTVETQQHILAFLDVDVFFRFAESASQP